MSELVKSISSGLLKTLPGPIASKYKLDLNDVTVFLTELINKQFNVVSEVPKVTVSPTSVPQPVSQSQPNTQNSHSTEVSSSLRSQRIQNGYIMFSMDQRAGVVKELSSKFQGEASMSNNEKLKLIQTKLREKWSKLSNEEKVQWVKLAEQYNLSVSVAGTSKSVESVPYILSQKNDVKPVVKPNVVANTVVGTSVSKPVIKPVANTVPQSKPVVNNPVAKSAVQVVNNPVKSLIPQKSVPNSNNNQVKSLVPNSVANVNAGSSAKSLVANVNASSSAKSLVLNAVPQSKPVFTKKPAAVEEVKEDETAEGTETVSSFSD